MLHPKTKLIAVAAIISALTTLNPGVSLAADDTVSQAASLVRAGKNKEAYELLQPLESEHAGDPEFDYLLGIAAIESGNAHRGIFALERVLAVNPDHAAARVAIARAHFMLGENESARQEFKNILDQHPPEDAITAINRYMSAIDRALGNTARFGAYLEATWGHDSNINGAPTAQTVIVNFSGIPLPVTLSGTTARKSDNFVTAGGGANFNYPINKNLSLFGSVSGNHRINWSSGMFETGSRDVNLGLSHKLGPNTVTVALQDGVFSLDGDTYRHSYGFIAQAQHNLDDHNQISAFGQALRLSYPTAHVQDTDRGLIGVGYGHAFSGDLSPVLFLNGYVGKEEARTDNRPDMGNDFYGIRTGGQITWNPKTVLFAAANYENRDYGGVKPFFTKSQLDHQYEFSIGARYLPIPLWQIKPQLSYLTNNSNLPITDYDRWMFSVTLRHDFAW